MNDDYSVKGRKTLIMFFTSSRKIFFIERLQVHWQTQHFLTPMCRQRSMRRVMRLARTAAAFPCALKQVSFPLPAGILVPATQNPGVCLQSGTVTPMALAVRPLVYFRSLAPCPIFLCWCFSCRCCFSYYPPLPFPSASFQVRSPLFCNSRYRY